MSGSFYPPPALNLGALCTFLFLTDRAPGVYQLTHNHGCIRSSASTVLEREDCAQFALMHFAFWIQSTYMCTVVIRIMHVSHLPHRLLFKLHFPSPDIKLPVFIPAECHHLMGTL